MKKISFSKKSNIILLAIIFIALFLRTYDLSQVWVSSHHGYNGAVYSSYAKNHLRYGLEVTKFGNLNDNGFFDPIKDKERLSFYINHGPMIPLLVTIPYSIFGFKEALGEFMIVLFGIGNLIILYKLGKLLWDTKTGLLIGLIYAIIPLAAIFDHHIEPVGTVVTFFSLVVFYSYMKLLKTQDNTYYFIMLIGLFLGSITDWEIYYAVPLIILHYLIFVKKKDINFKMLLFVIISCIFFIGYFAYADIFWNRDTSLQDLSTSLFFRSSSKYWGKDKIDNFSNKEWLVTEYKHLKTVNMFILLLSYIGLVGSMIRGRYKKESIRKGLIIILFIYGYFHIIFFRNGTWIHNYWSYFIIPFTAISSGLGIKYLIMIFKNRSIRNIVLISIFMILFITSFDIIIKGDPTPDNTYKIRGEIIKANTPKTSLILYPEAISPQTEFYSDREIIFDIYNKERLDTEIRKENIYTDTFLVIKESYLKELEDLSLDYLQRYEYFKKEGYYFFKVK